MALLSGDLELDQMATEQDPRVSAIAIGDQRIEYHKPDLTLAYSVLAPKVSEAWAFLRCGNIEEAKKAMASAQSVIDTAAMTSATIEIVGNGLSR